MEDKNIKINLFIKQLNQSNALGYNPAYIASTADYNFAILDRAYENTGKVYAELKTALNNNQCIEPGCKYETDRLKFLMEAPNKSLEFLTNIGSQLIVTNDMYYDVNQNYAYAVANAILTGKPTFAKSDGYNVSLQLIENGSQRMIFEGPMLDKPFVINSDALDALMESGTDIVATTPDINKDIYEVVEIGNGMARNILKYDLDKIERKVTPFINAEVAGMLSSEQSVVAAWNVFIGAGTSVSEDDQMAQNANAGFVAWSYKEDLPLMQDKKELFMVKYKEYFMNNYLKQFTTNQIPSVSADAVPFELETKEVKEATEQPQN